MTRLINMSKSARHNNVLLNGITAVVIISIFYAFFVYKNRSQFQTNKIFAVETLNQYFSMKDMQYNLLGVATSEYYNTMEGINCSLVRSPKKSETILTMDNFQIGAELLNAFRLQQDHPCVIHIIRRNYIKYPELFDTPLNLDYPEDEDPSEGQSKLVLQYLQNKTEGFFVECGAADGEQVSNTLYMERYLGWGGILIEADTKFYERLMTRKRKALALHACLSLEPFPTKVFFHEDGVAGKIEEGVNTSNFVVHKNGNLVSLQCFPLYSILLAVGRTKVDYFSVDVEGSEMKILRTIPWHKVDIKTLTVEVTSRNITVVEALVQYMKTQGFKKVGLMDGPSYYDLVFVK